MSEQLTLEELDTPKPSRPKNPHNEKSPEWHNISQMFKIKAAEYAAECGIEESHISSDTNKDNSVSFKIDGKLIAKLLPNPDVGIAFPVGLFNKYAKDCSFSPIKSPEGYGKISTDSINLALDMLKKAIADYVPSHTFGCCSRYKECSHAKKCIHPDLFYAKGCYYRKNLEADRIFYKE